MLPWYVGDFTLRSSVKNFERAKQVLMNADKPMVAKRRSERKYNRMESNSYVKFEAFSENKEFYINGFKGIETKKLYNYLLFGCESEEQ